MLPVHDMPIRAQLPFAADVQAKGLFAANASGRGCWHSTSPTATDRCAEGHRVAVSGLERTRGE